MHNGPLLSLFKNTDLYFHVSLASLCAVRSIRLLHEVPVLLSVGKFCITQ